MQRQVLTQKQIQRLSPQQIQQIKLLELSVTDLDRRVNEELEENPALEENRDNTPQEEEADDRADSSADAVDTTEEIPAYRLHDGSYSRETRDRSFAGQSRLGFYDILLAQLSLRPVSERQRAVAAFIICCLDGDGYLRRPLSEIADDMAFTENQTVSEPELEDMLRLIQDFEPAGIGARSLQECLLLQLNAREEQTKSVLLAKAILERSFDDFSGKRYDKICADLGVSIQEVKAAAAEITRLSPRPGAGVGEDTAETAPPIIPDFVVEYKDGALQYSLTARNAPELRISPEYVSLLKSYAKNREAASFVRQKIDDARWFLDAIQRRHVTLAVVMSNIVQKQEEFFITGDEAKLQPMVMRTVADDTGYDLSTISRVVSNKYVQTNFGIYPLKFFFSEAMKTEDGEEVSNRKIKAAIKKLVDEEDKDAPMSDDEIAGKLKAQGYIIARRTVAKYRDMLNIPVARLRRSS
ncbi:MAG: RNA polymerase factor sigma-54 [Prevotellaceae bacterium]|nr:RNA polymerase factor sigma-54 [Prevotellaceae bacterium]